MLSNIYWMVGSCVIEGSQKPMSIMSLELWKLMHLKLHNQQPVIIGKIMLSIVQMNNAIKNIMYQFQTDFI